VQLRLLGRCGSRSLSGLAKELVEYYENNYLDNADAAPLMSADEKAELRAAARSFLSV
jgi:hypothetical protein